jgi:signal transduction histidine kinase
LELIKRKTKKASDQATEVYFQQMSKDVELLNDMVEQLLERARLEAWLRTDIGGEKNLIDFNQVVSPRPSRAWPKDTLLLSIGLWQLKSWCRSKR